MGKQAEKCRFQPRVRPGGAAYGAGNTGCSRANNNSNNNNNKESNTCETFSQRTKNEQNRPVQRGAWKRTDGHPGGAARPTPSAREPGRPSSARAPTPPHSRPRPGLVYSSTSVPAGSEQTHWGLGVLHTHLQLFLKNHEKKIVSFSQMTEAKLNLKPSHQDNPKQPVPRVWVRHLSPLAD